MLNRIIKSGYSFIYKIISCNTCNDALKCWNVLNMICMNLSELRVKNEVVFCCVHIVVSCVLSSVWGWISRMFGIQKSLTLFCCSCTPSIFSFLCFFVSLLRGLYQWFDTILTAVADPKIKTQSLLKWTHLPACEQLETRVDFVYSCRRMS